ncbi:VOC family protein [Aurantimonas sp. HBX-1]|uniref:VOC family protein n=1 Tax=Aurantimonas sp. HBX-1 TaxID=2906072 RepID=UPI001F3D5AD9|nr:VOC family protein [Aurantimonas sp. HBX-1]UIJ73448.1 VOC family protein [Aurantimonas sp. HBX-1]
MNFPTRMTLCVASCLMSICAAAQPAHHDDASSPAVTSEAQGPKPIHLLHGTGLHHINVAAFDMDETIAFYEQAFGFELLFRWDGVDAQRGGQIHFRNPLRGAQMDMGDGQILEIISAPDNAGRPDGSDASLHHIGLRVSDLEAAYDRALAAGAKPHPIEDGKGGIWDGPTTITLKAQPPFERSFEVRAAHVEGPNGEIIELFES